LQSDVCASCRHNPVARRRTKPLTMELAEELFTHSLCELRKVKITDPFWTNCFNWISWNHPEPEREEYWDKIEGSIYKLNVYMPWLGLTEPKEGPVKKCTVCCRSADKGFLAESSSVLNGFCCAHCYMEYWNSWQGGPPLKNCFPPPKDEPIPREFQVKTDSHSQGKRATSIPSPPSLEREWSSSEIEKAVGEIEWEDS